MCTNDLYVTEIFFHFYFSDFEQVLSPFFDVMDEGFDSRIQSLLLHYPLNEDLDENLVNQTVGKVLDIFQIDHHLFDRWRSSKLKCTFRKKVLKI
jgi:hypothetical protein